MPIYIYFFSITLTIFFMFFFGLFSEKLNLIDKPSKRKKHFGNIPLVGGLSIYLSLFIMLFFVDSSLSKDFKLIFYISSFLIIMGMFDDSLDLHYLTRFISQLLVIFLAISQDLVIFDFGEVTYFDLFKLNKISILFTIISFLGLINAINFIDGIDGLSTSMILIALISIIVFSNIYSNYNDFNFIKLFITSLLAFFVFNLNLLKIKKFFLGDAGTVTLGFILGCLFIYYSQEPIRAIHPVLISWCITIPIYDLMLITLRRILNNQNPFKPDNLHLHHRLMIIGLTPIQTLISIILLQICTVIIGGLIFFKINSFISLISFFALFFLYALFIYTLRLIQIKLKK